MTAEPREPDDFDIDDPACWFADADAIRADDPLAASLLAAIGRQVQAERTDPAPQPIEGGISVAREACAQCGSRRFKYLNERVTLVYVDGWPRSRKVEKICRICGYPPAKKPSKDA